jgi:hypothetical protein
MRWISLARRISLARNPDAFYIITIKFLKSLARNFQTFQSGLVNGTTSLLLFADELAARRILERFFMCQQTVDWLPTPH